MPGKCEVYPLRRECDAVADAARAFVGCRYLITREYRPDSIDCSTVVSQAHWLGAAVQTPFIAQGQRDTPNALTVEYEMMLPGDATFAYSSPADAPFGRHNHVALYLGFDAMYRRTFVQSTEELGAHLATEDAIRAGGGSRRFCPNPTTTYAEGAWSELTRRVPKLGRLGARLTSKYDVDRRHRGIDIYCDEPDLVLATHAGVSTVSRGANGTYWAHISDQVRGLYTRLGPLDPLCSSPQARVEVGEPLGYVSQRKQTLHCNSLPGISAKTRLHWETWSRLPLGSPSPLPGVVERCAHDSVLLATNGIYAVKLDLLGPPVVPGRLTGALSSLLGAGFPPTRPR